MALHPQCKAFLDQLAAMGGTPLHEMTPSEARGMAMPPELAGPEQALHSVVDRTVPGPAGQIPVRVYTPTPGSRSARPDLLSRRRLRPRHAGLVGPSVPGSCASRRTASSCRWTTGSPLNIRFRPPVDDAVAATTYVMEHARRIRNGRGSDRHRRRERWRQPRGGDGAQVARSQRAAAGIPAARLSAGRLRGRQSVDARVRVRPLHHVRTARVFRRVTTWNAADRRHHGRVAVERRSARTAAGVRH